MTARGRVPLNLGDSNVEEVAVGFVGFDAVDPDFRGDCGSTMSLRETVSSFQNYLPLSLWS